MATDCADDSRLLSSLQSYASDKISFTSPRHLRYSPTELRADGTATVWAGATS